MNVSKNYISYVFKHSLIFSLTVGKNSSSFCLEVEAVETRVQPQAGNWAHTYGTIDCGLELMRDAWQRLVHVFSVEQEHLTDKVPITIMGETLPCVSH